MAQLSFSFSDDQNYAAEDFIFLDENLSARNFLNSFFVQKDFTKSQLTSLILKGEKASGKTHLLHIFAKKFGAEFLDSQKISQLNLANFFTQNHFYILDDFDEIADEEILLRLINSAAEAKAFLLLSAQNISRFKLRDLVSRLKNIFIAEIKNLGLDAVEQLLANGLARRQIKLSKQEIKLMSNKIDRSYAAILEVLNEISL